MKCRLAAATRVASLKRYRSPRPPKRKHRTHHALVKDPDEFVSCCIIFSLSFTPSTVIHGLLFFIEAAGWRVNRVRSLRNNLIRRDLRRPYFGYEPPKLC